MYPIRTPLVRCKIGIIIFLLIIIRKDKEVKDMDNKGVKCDVCECRFNAGCNKCTLETIEVTHMKTGEDCVSTPHFCKSFAKK